jgi:hypothetical protein
MTDHQLRQWAARSLLLCVTAVLAALAYRWIAHDEFSSASIFTAAIAICFLVIVDWRILKGGNHGQRTQGR